MKPDEATQGIGPLSRDRSMPSKGIVPTVWTERRRNVLTVLNLLVNIVI